VFLYASSMAVRPTAAPLPLLRDAATNTVNDWPALPSFPLGEGTPTGPGSAYVVARAALSINIAHVEKPAVKEASPEALIVERARVDSENVFVAGLMQAGPAVPPGQSVAFASCSDVAHVGHHVVAPSPDETSESDDECTEMYAKYGVVQTE
jgi:hypothetical protein